MKKKVLKKGAAIILCATMLATAGCGKKNETVITQEKKTMSEEDKQYVYSLSTMDNADAGEANMEYFCQSGDEVYVFMTKYGTAEENYSNSYYVKKIGLDGTESDEVKLNISTDNVYFSDFTCDEDGNFYTIKKTYEDSYIEEDEESVEGEEVEADADTTDDEAVAENDADVAEESGENEESEDAEEESVDAEESTDYEETSGGGESSELVKFSPTGEELWSKPLVEEDKEGSIEDMIFAKDVGIMTSSQKGFVIYNADTGEGHMIDYGKAEGDNEYYYERSLFVLRDGNLYLQDNDDDWNYRISKYNKADESFTPVEKSYPDGHYGGTDCYPGKSFDLFYDNGSSILAYNLGDDEATKICDLTASDLLIEYVRYIYEADDGSLVVYSNMYGDDMNFYRLTKVDPKDVKDKEILVLGTVFINDEVRKGVVKFNQLHDDCRITIKDYFGNAPDTDDGLKKVSEDFNLDVTSGNAPDILLLNSYIPYESYIEKGLIEPLDSYLENDADINVDNYLPNVINAGKRHNKLYMVIPSFSVDTTVASAKALGGEKLSLMNYRDICSRNNVEVAKMMGYYSRDYVSSLYSTCGSSFVDYENGKCDFKNPAFIKFLEFINELPTTDEDYDWNSYETMYREKKALLRSQYMSSFEDFQVDKKGYFGEDIVFNGYPTADGGESYIVPLIQFGMSSTCSNKRAAWDFLRSFLKDDYQDKVYERQWGFPVSNKAFDALVSMSQEPPYYINEKGEKELTESYYSIGDTEIKIEALTKEEAEFFANFLKSVEKVEIADDKVTEIIEEEAGAYYEGQKTAEEVADIIQSRVSIYLSESK